MSIGSGAVERRNARVASHEIEISRGGFTPVSDETRGVRFSQRRRRPQLMALAAELGRLRSREAQDDTMPTEWPKMAPHIAPGRV